MIRKIVLILIANIAIFLLIFHYSSQEKIVDYSYNIIRLGQSLPLDGQAKDLGIELQKGANAYFTYINDNGGIYEQKIRLISLDNKNEPLLARKNIDTLIKKNKIFALFNIYGDQAIYNFLNIYNSNTPLVMPLSGLSILYENT